MIILGKCAQTILTTFKKGSGRSLGNYIWAHFMGDTLIVLYFNY